MVELCYMGIIKMMQKLWSMYDENVIGKKKKSEGSNQKLEHWELNCMKTGIITERI